MSGQSFSKTLQTAMQTISYALHAKYNNLLQERLASIPKNPKIEDLEEKRYAKYEEKSAIKAEYDAKIEAINKEIDFISAEILSLTDIPNYSEREEYRKKGVEISASATRQMWEEAVKCLETDEYKNRNEFEKIRKQFATAMDFATTTAEQRNILQQFYAIDWSSLGIEMPPTPNTSHIAIIDGKITCSNNTLSISAPKSE